ncbi:MAG TPA: ABC transporter permease [Thermoanaerobaculia bacterium]|nr:ABC transporter permease [Thermoanaerobaculia bacterium]
MFQELRYAVRRLIKSPGFAAIAIVTLALGIGAATAIFSVVDAVLLRPLPYPDPQKIAQVWEQTAKGQRINLSDPNFEDFRTQNDTFAALAEYAWSPASISGGSEPVRATVAAVSAGFFKTLGVTPSIGREFAADEQRLHGAPAAIVSDGYWQRYFGGTRDLSGLHLSIEGTVYPVVGVMPAGFDFPSGVAVWVPRELEAELPSRTAHNWHCIGRVREGVTIEQARANLSTIARRIRDQYGTRVDLDDAAVVPLADAMVGSVRTALLTLLGAVGLLLMVGCANVAGLLLARTSTRRRELALRAALGAGRIRLARQFLAESLVLSFAAGVAGVLIAAWAVKLLPAIIPGNLPRHEGIAMNVPVLAFALGITGVLAIALGLLAAWRSGSGSLQPALTAGSRSYTASRATQRVRVFLVIGEIAATLVILAGAGLFGRSFLRLVSTSPGFRTDDLITMEFSPPAPDGDAAVVRQIQTIDEILRRIRAIPGVQSAGVAGAIPVAGGDNLAGGTFLILTGIEPPTDLKGFEELSQNPARSGQALYYAASEESFRTLGIPLVAGRMFGEQDVRDAPHVALISRTLARNRWPRGDAIGQVLEFGNMDGDLKPLTVVGIVGDVRARGLDRPPSPIIYTDYRQRGVASGSPTILVRSSAPRSAVIPAARAIFHDLAPEVPVRFSTFADEMGGWLANRRFLLLLVGVFAVAALALAALGIYGVVAYSVARRTQEIGVRMALGAQPGDVLRLVVGESARMAAAGAAIGIVLSLAVARLMSTLLFGIRATDPLTFVTVAALLVFIAMIAAYVPARRAMRISPETALRYE